MGLERPPLPSKSEAEWHAAWYTGDWASEPERQCDYSDCPLAHWLRDRYGVATEDL